MRALRFLLLATVIVACDAENNDQPAPAPVVYADASDSAMNSAVQIARRELRVFEAVMKSPNPAQTGFGVKVAIPHSGGVEHLWLAEPKLASDSVTGVVEGTPLYATHVSQGSTVRVAQHAISDWMYLENGKLRGGYTMRVAIDRLPEAQRDEQRKAQGIE